MKIKSINVRNFRCFGDIPVTVDFSGGITALVGANGSGKTALLIALTRLFGTTQNQRAIKRSDFHLPPGVAGDERSAAELAMEIILTFPELTEGQEGSDTIPETFYSYDCQLSRRSAFLPHQGWKKAGLMMGRPTDA